MNSGNKYFEFVKAIVEGNGAIIHQTISKPDDYYVRFNDKTVFIFSMKHFKMSSTWQITDYVAKQINLSKNEFDFREVNIDQFPYRLTFSFSDVNNPKAKELMEKIVKLSCH